MLLSIFLLAIAGYAALLFFMSLKNYNLTFGRPVAAIMLGISILSLGFSFELLAESRFWLDVWSFISQIGYAVLLFSLAGILYSYHMGACPRERWKIASFALVPVSMLIMIATDPWHGLYYSSVEVKAFQGSTYLALEPSLGFMAVAAYAIILLIILLILLVRNIFGATQMNVRHMTTLAAAFLVALLISFITDSYTSTPSRLIEIVALAIVIYPIYAITFRGRINTWSLSFKEVLDLSSDIKIIIDTKQRIVYNNRQGQTFLDMNGDLSSISDEIAESFDAAAPYSKEIEIDMDPVRRTFNFESLPISSPSGVKQGLLITMKDITEKVAVRRSLEEVNEKIKLLSSISRHDMINQLTVISGLTYVLAGTAAGNEKAEGMVETINRATDAIHRQLMFMRDYEKIGLSHPEWMSIHDTAMSASQNYDLEGIDFELPEHDCEILADPLFEKVFINLMHNSIIHAQGLSRMTIELEREDEHLLIHYRDDGGGIPPEYRGSLFQKGKGRNTGLGLFLSKNILEITRMEISEEGVHGEGVDFIIKVPAGGYRC